MRLDHVEASVFLLSLRTRAPARPPRWVSPPCRGPRQHLQAAASLQPSGAVVLVFGTAARVRRGRQCTRPQAGTRPSERASERREQAVRGRGRSAPWISLRFYCSPQLRRTCPPRAQPGADERGGAGARGSGLDSDVYSNVRFFIIFFDYGQIKYRIYYVNS